VVHKQNSKGNAEKKTQKKKKKLANVKKKNGGFFGIFELTAAVFCICGRRTPKGVKLKAIKEIE